MPTYRPKVDPPSPNPYNSYSAGFAKPETWEEWAERHPMLGNKTGSRYQIARAKQKEAWLANKDKLALDQYQYDMSIAAQRQWELEQKWEQSKADWASEYSRAQEEWTRTSAQQQQDLKDKLLGEFKTQADTYNKRIEELKSMYSQRESGYKNQITQTHQDYANRDAEQKRIADMYGQSDRRSVKGVRTQDELSGFSNTLPYNFFRRTGNRMKTSSLNIS